MSSRTFKDSDRFNLMLALTAVLVDGKEYKVSELAAHFSVAEKEIIEAVRIISFTDIIQLYSVSPYQINIDDLNDGYVSMHFETMDVLHDVARLSSRQASALAAGLVYLASLPGVAEVGEIEQLQSILAKGIRAGETTVEFVISPGTPDADLAILREALAKRQAISCDYLNLKGETRIGRVIVPRRLEPQGEFTYLFGWCPENEEVRAFRIDRMRNAAILRDYEVSEAALNAELPEELYTPSESDTIVTLEVEPEAYSLITDFKPVEAPISIDNHIKRFKISVGDVLNLGRVIARFGGAARVIEPQSAKDAVREFALQAISGKKPKSFKEAE